MYACNLWPASAKLLQYLVCGAPVIDTVLKDFE